SSFAMRLRRSRATLFPYTTLFRSAVREAHGEGCSMSDRIWTAALVVIGDEILSGRTHDKNIAQVASWLQVQGIRLAEVRVVPDRSEEHTSELQSRENLVCRLLLEK